MSGHTDEAKDEFKKAAELDPKVKVPENER